MTQSHILLTRICPVCNGIAKRHRRRDYRFQYRCTECYNFFTEGSSYKTLGSGHHYDGFIDEYISKKSKGKNVNITELCKEFDLSRPTIYRSLKQFNFLVFIYEWFVSEGVVLNRNITNGTLNLDIVGCKIKTISMAVLPIKQEKEFNLIFESEHILFNALNLASIEVLDNSSSRGSVKITSHLDKDIVATILRPFRKLKL